ncbi:MAG: hypothetical protein PHD67_08095 [Oscillospiraceae bacterium]|nr:hypothetical protein [Oscillospiraceae bacterium]
MAALLEYKCPCCGGAIQFDSGSQKMKCPFCDTEIDPEALKHYDDDLKKESSGEIVWQTPQGNQWAEGETDGMRVYVCESCGGEIVCDENTAATACPFCSNPVVMKGQFSGSLRPDCIIPFKLDKAAAKAGLLQHFRGKILLPKVFKDENHIDEVKGVYVPFWIYGADAQARVRYRATRVRCWSDSRYDYTETSYYSVLRGGSLGFDHVPVDGSTKMADDLMESVEPFDFSGAVDFQTAYLAGYLADKYDVTPEKSLNRASERIRRSTEESFARTVAGYSSVQTESADIQLANSSSTYALYPVWLLNTTWNGNRYTFAMNGQTGKFVGNLPVDKAAFWRWFVGITAAVAAVSYGLAWLAYLL